MKKKQLIPTNKTTKHVLSTAGDKSYAVFAANLAVILEG